MLLLCYYYGGIPSADLPCDPSANISACYRGGSTCLINFYCIGGAIVKYSNLVGSCTDEIWYNPACPLPLDQLVYSLSTSCKVGSLIALGDSKRWYL